MEGKRRHYVVFGTAGVQLLLSICLIVTSGIIINGFESRRQYWHATWTAIWAIVSALIGMWSSISKFKPFEYLFIATCIATSIFTWNAILIIGIRDYMLTRPISEEECARDPLKSLYHKEKGRWVCVSEVLSITSLAMVVGGLCLFFLTIFSAIASCFALCRCCGATSQLSVTPITQPVAIATVEGYGLNEFVAEQYHYSEPPPAYDQLPELINPKSTVPTLPPILMDQEPKYADTAHVNRNNADPPSD